MTGHGQGICPIFLVDIFFVMMTLVFGFMDEGLGGKRRAFLEWSWSGFSGLVTGFL